MNDIRHITKSDFYAFSHDFMSKEEKEAFLEHIGSCDFCAEQFAVMMNDSLIEAPRDMKANILKTAKRPEVQIAIKARETSKRMQLFIYSLKVGTATAVALLLLFLTMNIGSFSTGSLIPEATKINVSTTEEDNIPLTAKIRDNMDALSSQMLSFSNNIINMEVNHND